MIVPKVSHLVSMLALIPKLRIHLAQEINSDHSVSNPLLSQCHKMKTVYSPVFGQEDKVREEVFLQR